MCAATCENSILLVYFEDNMATLHMRGKKRTRIWTQIAEAIIMRPTQIVRPHKQVIPDDLVANED